MTLKLILRSHRIPDILFQFSHPDCILRVISASFVPSLPSHPPLYSTRHLRILRPVSSFSSTTLFYASSPHPSSRLFLHSHHCILRVISASFVPSLPSHPPRYSTRHLRILRTVSSFTFTTVFYASSPHPSSRLFLHIHHCILRVISASFLPSLPSHTPLYSTRHLRILRPVSSFTSTTLFYASSPHPSSRLFLHIHHCILRVISASFVPSLPSHPPLYSTRHLRILRPVSSFTSTTVFYASSPHPSSRLFLHIHHCILRVISASFVPSLPSHPPLYSTRHLRILRPVSSFTSTTLFYASSPHPSSRLFLHIHHCILRVISASFVPSLPSHPPRSLITHMTFVSCYYMSVPL